MASCGRVGSKLTIEASKPTKHVGQTGPGVLMPGLSACQRDQTDDVGENRAAPRVHRPLAVARQVPKHRP
jgi:hypothetical protein